MRFSSCCMHEQNKSFYLPPRCFTHLMRFLPERPGIPFRVSISLAASNFNVPTTFGSPASLQSSFKFKATNELRIRGRIPIILERYTSSRVKCETVAGSIRSLFPRLESIYVASRAITAVAVLVWMLTSLQTDSAHRALAFGMVIFGAHLLIFYFIWRKRPKFISDVFAYSLIFDIIFVTYLIKYTGGAFSGFYLLYYVAIMFSAYYFSLNTCVATLVCHHDRVHRKQSGSC